MGVGLSAVEQETKLLDRAEAADPDRGAGVSRPEPPQERLGGARADFVATLGRRVAEIARILKQLTAEPDSVRIRDDLRRRLHALGAGARLLRFTKLAEGMSASEELLTHSSEHRTITASDCAQIRAMLDRLPALAWGEASVGETTPVPARVATPRSGRTRTPAPLATVRGPLGPTSDQDQSARGPITVLVVGPATIADALVPTRSEPSPPASITFEVERAVEHDGALGLARAVAPDVVVVDADRAGALALCEALMSDPLTELVPIIILGRFSSPDTAAPYVALGVAKALPKPVSPDTLRRMCAEVVATYVHCESSRMPLGELTVDGLSERLAEELRRGLCDATVASGRAVRFDLREGSDVLAALWGAVARIRDIVTIHSAGEVRFAPSGPEGALPLAPWLGEGEIGSTLASVFQQARRQATIELTRKVVVVADDDPAVTWFLSGVLQAAGAVVYEAHDGMRALEIAFRFTPDLVISDILMPELDGFGLCRALRRDLILRDVPVILLSWKEDLLQRVRELGADADGYLRKEASAAVIVQRVREVLHARARIAERIASSASSQGEVRGRIDGITTRTLLGLACAHRPASIVTARDAAFLYEVEIRDGCPVRATRTAPDGSFERGHSVLAALLGVGAGRFAVAPAPENPFPAELEGTLDEQLLPTIALARAAQRLLSGVALIGVERVELTEAKMAAYTSATPEPARSLLRSLAAGVSPRALITSGQAAPRLVEDVLCDAAAHGAITAVIGPEGDELLEEAIEREIGILRGEEKPRPKAVTPVLDLGPNVETGAPAHRAPLAEGSEVNATETEATRRASAAAALPITLEIPKVLAAAPVPEAKTPELKVQAIPFLTPPAVVVAEDAPYRAPEPNPLAAPNKSLLTLDSPLTPSVTPAPLCTPSPPPKAASLPPVIVADESPSRASPRPSVFTPASATLTNPARKDKGGSKESHLLWVLFAITGVVFAIVARVSRDHHDVANAAPAPPAGASAANVTAAVLAPKAEPAGSPSGDGESRTDPILPVQSALREEDKVSPGQGMLEVTAGASDAIYVDGTFSGNGPIVKRALAARKEPYEIRVKLRGEERVRFALVKEARLTRLRVAPPWSR
jgi:CheY-like chemotaxis protein